MTSQILQYGGIHDSHLKYIQTTITSLFLGQFWKLLYQNKWFVKHFTTKYLTTYIAFPFKSLSVKDLDSQVGKVGEKNEKKSIQIDLYENIIFVVS